MFIYLFIFICMYVCISSRRGRTPWALIFTRYTYMYICIYVCIYIYICKCMYIYIYVCMYVCIYVMIFLHLETCLHESILVSLPLRHLLFPHYCNTIARLLRSVRPPPDPLLYGIHNTTLVVAILCRGQPGSCYSTGLALRGILHRHAP